MDATAIELAIEEKTYLQLRGFSWKRISNGAPLKKST
jgi:hypothetical protein